MLIKNRLAFILKEEEFQKILFMSIVSLRAVANALFKATGKRFYNQPFKMEVEKI
jgi:hypothetical protein